MTPHRLRRPGSRRWIHRLQRLMLPVDENPIGQQLFDRGANLSARGMRRGTIAIDPVQSATGNVQAPRPLDRVDDFRDAIPMPLIMNF